MKWLLLIIFPLIVCQLSAQNMLKDGSFEDYDPCPELKEKEWFPLENWNRLSNSNSTDYYNTDYKGCYKSSMFYPGGYRNNPYAEANTGSAYIGMYPCGLNLKSITVPGYIEPVIGILTDTLQKDSTYRVSLSIYLPVTSAYNVRSFSLVFLADTFKYPPHVSFDFHELWAKLNGTEAGIAEFDISSTIYNRSQWLTFDTTYKATGKERYLLAGFYPKFTEEQKEEYAALVVDKKTKKLYKKLSKYYTLHKEKADRPEGDFKDAYFYIDDVQVELLTR